MGTLAEVIGAAVGADLSSRVDSFLSSFDDEYYRAFSHDKLVDHFRAWNALSSDQLFRIMFETRADRTVVVSVVCYDYPGLLSLMTGLLAASGFNITSGHGYSSKSPTLSKQQMRKLVARRSSFKTAVRRSIVDVFEGVVADDVAFVSWTALVQERFQELFSLLGDDGDHSRQKATLHVNRLISNRLVSIKLASDPVLYPIEIDIDNEDPAYTTMVIRSQDTPMFLYAFTQALAMNGIFVARIEIKTDGGQICDTFWLLDVDRKKILDQDRLDRLKLSVMLTKQFTYYLDQSADPFSALQRFEQLIGEILKEQNRVKWLRYLSHPKGLQDLATVLGASDFLWEEFIRMQYESLLPMMMPHLKDRHFYSGKDTIRTRLDKALEGLSYDEQREALNAFKDSELFLIDLNHILGRVDFREFSLQLSVLADAVVLAAAHIVYAQLVSQYGVPQTVGQLDVAYGIFGLGKLGGEALGYASDIELLFVYSDQGETLAMDSSQKTVSNQTFFSEMVVGIKRFVDAKQDGIFDIDLRLRPYGADGPFAVSLDAFCEYYGPEGDAHFYERLALVRMRFVGGDMAFCDRLIRLRNEFVFESGEMDESVLWELRKKQFQQKVQGREFNAKFSPGALVDIEYAVQALQVRYGREHSQLRTAKIHVALDELLSLGILEGEDAQALRDAYGFFRVLINGLRMLRGSAKDLVLPPKGSAEYGHLARRIGYSQRQDALDPAGQLYLDYQLHCACVRQFVESYFSGLSVPSESYGNIADVVLRQSLASDVVASILSARGISDSVRALDNIRNVSQRVSSKMRLSKVFILLFDGISQQSDPDRALNNWERFVSGLDDVDGYLQLMLDQPRRLDLLLKVLSVSQYLAEVLIRYPSYFEIVTSQQGVYGKEYRGRLSDEISDLGDDDESWMNGLRLLKHREFLRIAIKDVALHLPFERIVRDISFVTEDLIRGAYERAWDHCKACVCADLDLEMLKDGLCVLVMGKLGGTELNYSSDVDLVCVYDDGLFADSGVSKESLEQVYTTVIKRFIHYVTHYTQEGFLFRIDFALRPYGRGGLLVASRSFFESYYREEARCWEKQALLKMRPLLGNWSLGYSLIEEVCFPVWSDVSSDEVVESIKSARLLAIKQIKSKLIRRVDVKNGEGGIRDIEFLIQGLQLMYIGRHPSLYSRSTLAALDAIEKLELLPVEVVTQLRVTYLFFRQLEHFLQILDDRQTHYLPEEEMALLALAKHMEGVHSTTEMFQEKYKVLSATVRGYFETYLVKEDG